MEFPALVTTFTSALKLGFGAVVLLAGYGIIGVAFVSIVVNLISAVVLVGLLLRVLGPLRPLPDTGFALALGRSSYPLMINNLLATVFFRVDGLILRASAGDAVLGWYGMAYKFIDGLTIVSTNVTLALFPMLSRLALDAPAPGHGVSLRQTTRLALKALIGLAFPIAVGTTVLADPIIRLLAGDEYLPHSANALRVLIWFLPFSFSNALLQYVLIALNRQRFITGAFAIATGFNVLANLLLIPRFGYIGAAVTTIASELVLLVMFSWAVRGQIQGLGLLSLAWRPAAAAAGMAPVVWLLQGVPVLAIPIASIFYVALFWALGGVTRAERDALQSAFRGGPPGPASVIELQPPDA
jgi:O-antigen/teichoic acid export membrane protein